MVEAGKGLEAGVPQASSKALPAAAAKLTSAFEQLPPRCLTVPHFVRVQKQFSLPTPGLARQSRVRNTGTSGA